MVQGNRILRGVVMDVDGVLWISNAPSKGSVAFLDDLRKSSIPFCLLTNDCSVLKSKRQQTLNHAGLVLSKHELVMAAEVTNEWLKKSKVKTIMYLGNPNTLYDIKQGLIVRENGPVEAVVMGDIFKHYDRSSLDRAAKAIKEGALLIAMQRNPYWFDGNDSYVDNGFWVAGLEYVTGKQAIVTGKPSKHAYLSAISRLGLSTQDYSRIGFISDDISSDLKGAKAIGMTTIYLGSSQSLPIWVDYAMFDLDATLKLLLGN